jgi:hypothetical protein
MSDLIQIKHLESPNITTFVNGKQIEIRNHSAFVDRETAKAMMEGPFGYELVGIYDNFLEFTNNIPVNLTEFEGLAAPDSTVIVATPLAGHKLYSWARLTESFLASESKRRLHIVFTIDDPNAEWRKSVEDWAQANVHNFKKITIIIWDHDAIMAWNRVFKITVGRQLIFNYARTTDASHLWFVDSDTIHKGDALPKLLSHNRDCVSGLYHFKSVMGGGPVVFDGQGDRTMPPSCLGKQRVEVKPNSGLYEVDWTGAGSLLVTKKIFSRYNFNWSKWIQRNGEDAWLCMMAQHETKQKTLVDTSVHAVHLDESGREW